MTTGRKKIKKETTTGPDYQELSLFFQTFVGEFVEVTTDIMIKTQIDTEEGIALQESPLSIQGFLLDEDDKYYYLGSGPGEIEHAVKIENVKAIGIAKVKSVYDDVFDAMPDPEKDEEIN
jgi:hypothetical protein